MNENPVFYDPKGKRSTMVLGLIAAAGLIVFLLAATALFVTLLLNPNLPRTAGPKPSALPGVVNRDPKRADLLTGGYRRKLSEEIAKEQRRLSKAPMPVPDKIVAAFYAPWEASGLNSLQANAGKLTHVLPQWLHLNDQGKIDFRDFDLQANPSNAGVIKVARQNGLRVVPILDNAAAGGTFDPKVVARLLASPEDQQTLAANLRDWLLQNRFQGLNLDFEELGGDESRKLVGFLNVLKSQLEPHGLSLSMDVETGNDELPLKEASDACDFLVLMDYDQHSESGEPGPISSIDWVDQQLERTLRTVPEEKLVLGIGNYAYDWVKGKSGGQSISYQDAIATAQGYREEPPQKVVQFDEDALNPYFEYLDDHDVRHVVWMLDGTTAYNSWHESREYGVRGAALWVLGEEDPSLWAFYDRRKVKQPLNPSALNVVHFPFEVSFQGRGEILSVKARPHNGARTVQIDASSGLITDETYLQYGSPYIVQKSGYQPMKLALTFDDGPDARYTPEVLDVLKALKAPATFFVLGLNAEGNPRLVRRMIDEGHEVGSHTFDHPDMGAIGPGWATAQLNLTQMAIESITNRSTILFRPPYNADSEPETAAQVAPVDLASKLGYVTVGENVDPTDWDLKVPLPDGGYRRKTAQDIVDFVVSDLKRRQGTDDEGNMILLHDAGGDRSATVEALKILIPKLRAEGYQFVSVSELMGKTRAQVMPPVPEADRIQYFVGKFILGTFFTLEGLLATAFVLAIALGLARLVLMTPLAVAYERRRRRQPLPPYQPTLSVLIAGYNEEKVIVRTIASVLTSDYPLEEVIVIDDGSTDRTSEVVAEAYGNDPRVRLITQPNGGKASALNRGITEAKGEVLFCIDADTQLDPAAIGLLARHFQDPEVGAVAGNVIVGNPINLITKWQEIEYTTSQNLDRRAYALLNAITVVPGANGAWRRSAVLEVGGYLTDTLAEDMDLTWRLRRAGYRQENESEALAYTEAPETFRAFFRQRFRWAYGTLQCLWKHRSALFRHGWFGRLALPTLWLFQIVFQALAPLIDLQILYSLIAFGFAYARSRTTSESDVMPVSGATDSLIRVALMYAIFFVAEFVAALIAYRLERKSIRSLGWLFLQRFVYRQIMYGVIYRSIVRALRGNREGWNKLDRKGTVRIPTSN